LGNGILKILGVITARMASQRLPGKALKRIGQKPMIAHIVDRLRRCQKIDEIILATTTERENDPLEKIMPSLKIAVFRGEASDVLNRVLSASIQFGGEVIVQASGDNPLVDPEIIDRAISKHLEAAADFTYCAGYPLGTYADIFSLATLKRIEGLTEEPAHREHINAYIFDHPNDFKVARLTAPTGQFPPMRLTVDTKEDFALITQIYERLYRVDQPITGAEIIQLYFKNPELFAINSKIVQKYSSQTVQDLRTSLGKD
jgi:spore coat polysaccharide biosynthesis protein SpsF